MYYLKSESGYVRITTDSDNNDAIMIVSVKGNATKFSENNALITAEKFNLKVKLENEDEN